MDDQSFEFSAIRGKQAGKEYYLLFCPLKLLSKIFSFEDETIPPHMKAHRVLHQGKIKEIKKYLLENPENYILPPITVSVDCQIEFEALGELRHQRNLGILRVPMVANMVVNDGQHRQVAIKEVLQENPQLGTEQIGVTLFVEQNHKKSQQVFIDLNYNVSRPAKSFRLLHEKEEIAQLVKRIVQEVEVFNGMTELEKSSISNRSTKLFTLSGIYHATMALLGKSSEKQPVSNEESEFAVQFWQKIAENIPDWLRAKEGNISGYELRKNFIHTHAVVLLSLGNMGAFLIKEYPENWDKIVLKINVINWSRSNTELWEGRAMLGGKVNKARLNVTLTTIALKQFLNIPLTNDEQSIETQFQSNRSIE